LRQARVGGFQIGTVGAVFSLQTDPFQRLANGVIEHRKVFDGLGDEVRGTELEGGNGVGHVARARDDDHRQLRKLPVEHVQYRQAVHLRHAQIA
jgi:hypothetical protein